MQQVIERFGIPASALDTIYSDDAGPQAPIQPPAFCDRPLTPLDDDTG